MEKERLTINFLFVVFLDKMPETLQNQAVAEEEILEIQFFEKSEITKLVGQAEHNLAKARLEVFLSNNFEPNLNPILIF